MKHRPQTEGLRSLRNEMSTFSGVSFHIMCTMYKMKKVSDRTKMFNLIKVHRRIDIYNKTKQPQTKGLRSLNLFLYEMDLNKLILDGTIREQLITTFNYTKEYRIITKIIV